MKKIITLALTALLAWSGLSAQTPVQREMRSAWVATVWQLDWPQTVISETGNQTQINKQKQQMTTMLDSLALNNFNAINFQVRSRCDAMYRSSYEPWSSDLVSTRGLDPGWDPLEWVVEECHKRGIECHAWLNPYRYESVAGQWNGTAGVYRDTNPDWLMDVKNSSGTASILNPGIPEVTQRICDIIKEIVQNYDVDGILFDDYFYLSGTSNQDDTQFNAYRNNGGTLNRSDWRRDNVNRMIASVYSTIKSTKPWVRFGVSPAGIAATSSSVASKYGVRPCPTGGDWQYNDIYSDPLAWVSSQSLDFISPQIYWTVAYSTHYDLATEWWSEVAAKFGRHMYVSHSISSLNSSSKAPMSSPERASGAGGETFQEYADQVNLNRQFSLDDAPGSIFYSAKYLYRSAPLFSHFLRNTVFTTPCLVPPMTWMNAPTPEAVENLTRSGSVLSWTEKPGMRYSIYAFPEGMAENQMVRVPDYLVGVSYSTSFTLPAGKLSGYKYGVCTLDRYGNESSLAMAGVPSRQMDPAVAVFPINNVEVEAPFNFSWTAPEAASEFVVEIASDPQMTQRLDQRSTVSTMLSSGVFNTLPLDVPLYWRVRACGPGYKDGLSQVQSFVLSELRISTPGNNEMIENLTPTFTYSITDREVTLELATDEEFKKIEYTHTHTGSHTVGEFALSANTEYWARGQHVREGEALTTAAVHFTTPAVDAHVPTIACPIANGELHADQMLAVNRVPGAVSYRIDLCVDQTFGPRNTYTASKVDHASGTDAKRADAIKVANKNLVDGTTYYVRARASFNNDNGTSFSTDYCEPVAFVYRSSESGVENIAAETAWITLTPAGAVINENVANLVVTSTDGRTFSYGAVNAGTVLNLDYAPGVYMISADAHKTVKIVR